MEGKEANWKEREVEQLKQLSRWSLNESLSLLLQDFWSWSGGLELSWVGTVSSYLYVDLNVDQLFSGNHEKKA